MVVLAEEPGASTALPLFGREYDLQAFLPCRSGRHDSSWAQITYGQALRVSV